jgi:hypothetical protein
VPPDLAAAIRATAEEVVHPSRTVDAVSEDPDDNRVLECAIAAGASYIELGALG